MLALRYWRVGGSLTHEVFRYAPEQEPPVQDIDHFVAGTVAPLPLMPLQTSRFVLRQTYQTLSWLKAYVRCEVEALRAEFVREDKSFYLAFLEHSRTGDRSISFRLTTAGLSGHTEWLVSFRRVRVDGDPEHFLCAEY